jgi:cytidyltransferase-like protein
MKETTLKNTENNLVVVFPGRFQPFHLGHQCFYENLCEKFGKENVWIASSNKKSKRSPLSFRNKKRLAVKAFNIPANRFIQCESPYNPIEILEKFDSTKVSLVLALGNKDKERLAEGEFFEFLPKKIKGKMKNSKQITYVYHGPMFANGRNASAIREQFQAEGTVAQKKLKYLKMFGSFDQKIFEALVK